MTPAQVATERPNPGMGSIVESAVMLTTLPAPRAFMWGGAAARMQRTTLIRFWLPARFHAWSSKPVAGIAWPRPE